MEVLFFIRRGRPGREKRGKKNSSWNRGKEEGQYQSESSSVGGQTDPLKTWGAENFSCPSVRAYEKNFIQKLPGAKKLK